MIFINNVISPLKVNNRFYCVKSIYTGKNDTAYVLPDFCRCFILKNDY